LGFVGTSIAARRPPLADARRLQAANFLRRLFAEGAFNAGFKPMFAHPEGRRGGKAFAERRPAVVACWSPGGR
jgi:hypothetical protein